MEHGAYAFGADIVFFRILSGGISVAVHRADGGVTLFEDGGRLEDPEALPGFELEISTLFAL